MKLKIVSLKLVETPQDLVKIPQKFQIKELVLFKIVLNWRQY